MTELATKKCTSCESGAEALSVDKIRQMLKEVPEWKLTADNKRIRREWRVKDFAEAIVFFDKVADIAETEDHHPDLHLVGYRNVAIEIWTHAVGGLTDNDFILAAKIDGVPVALKS